MKKNKNVIDKFLFENEEVICESTQKSIAFPWFIKNFLAFLIVIGGILAVYMFLPFIPSAWKDFVNAHIYIYFIYGGIAALWLAIILVRLSIISRKFKKHTIYLTTRRLLVHYGRKITDITFGGVYGVTLLQNRDEDYSGSVSVEIYTPQKLYALDKMKNGSKLVNMLSRIIHGEKIQVVSKKEEVPEKKEAPKLEPTPVQPKQVEKVEEIKQEETVEEQSPIDELIRKRASFPFKKKDKEEENKPLVPQTEEQEDDNIK